MKSYQVTGWVHLKAKVNKVVQSTNERQAITDVYHSFEEPGDYRLQVKRVEETEEVT